VLTDVVSFVSPEVFIEKNRVIASPNRRTPFVVCVVNEVRWRES